ncbi:MAG: lytic transglycosylase domain-containing protein [Candidatus Riflebacteria bacterium]|nr:lytic transglycosylase domain-containing protein [Candidatus Riflebacteria bacterium]
MAQRRQHREKQTFAAALNEARKVGPEPETEIAPATTFGKPTSPGLIPNSPLGLNPLSETIPGVVNPDTTDFATQLLPLIQEHATRNNLDPALVKRIIEVESDFNPRALSSKGAMGLMQLMPSTARELGVDDPYDPEQNISAGTRYLAQLLQANGGNMAKALASYNAGPGVVRQYGGIPPYAETKKFISRIMSQLPEPSKTTKTNENL